MLPNKRILYGLTFTLLTGLAAVGCNPPPPEATDPVEELGAGPDTLQGDSIYLDREKTRKDQIKVEGYEGDTIPLPDSVYNRN